MKSKEEIEEIFVRLPPLHQKLPRWLDDSIELDTDRVIESSAIIGIVCTADDADADVFPLNEPSFHFGTRNILDKAGTTGTLAKSLCAIRDQYEPIVMIVRAEEAEDPAQTVSNIIAALQTLLSCEQKFGYKPHILGVPKHDKHPAIVRELGIIAEKLHAFAYIGVDAEKAEDVVLYLNKRIILISSECKGWDTSARILGLRSKVDGLGGMLTLANE